MRGADTGWFTSTRSSGASNNCVEVRRRSDRVLVRDSKNRSGAVFAFGRGEWGAFLSRLKRG
ncbi:MULTISPECIES: DUF397 domain-containing protein [Actinoalloteichus]|uniref:DUF397 family protein n=1 Tax=Actinoalloteichus fjordicus TaxID=1612552 RepID=A0AAC9PPT3_9PSEU|nr:MULTISPECIES: DUF397 domain-containing protein [Actinoalloteichus]APU12394.1 putative DUF397 family protein [Actinoalloteichus fjordicus]APU18346.1 putative DUF397 family protein [Actinoalloteichus sp. GBA129-24]